MDHESRMEIARRVKDFLMSHHADIVAVSIEGSTAKGEDREHSDLEMAAVVRGEPDTRGYQLIWEGIVVEVDMESERDALRQAASVDWEWPMWADGYVSAFALHDPEGLLPRLSVLAANPDPTKVASAARHAYTSMYEDLCKLRNFAASGEDGLLHLMSTGFALYGLARFLGLVNRQYFNGIRNLLTKPRDFATLPQHFWEDYPVLLASQGSNQELLERAERMYRECHDILVRGGNALPGGVSLEAALEAGRSPK